MSDTDRIELMIDALERRYDAENDIIKDAPAVTYADMQLIEMVKQLVKIVNNLEYQIDSLRIKP